MVPSRETNALIINWLLSQYDPMWEFARPLITKTH